MTDSVVPAVSCRIPQEKDSFCAAAEEVMHLVASGRTGRGISGLGSVSAWLSAVALLEKPERIAVVTGFFVPEKGDLVSEGAVASIGPGGAAETDGPPGAVILGRALARLGKDVSLVTDALCAPALEACSAAVGGPPVRCAACGAEVLAEGPRALVFLERLGRSADGRYRNMRGEDISVITPPLDDAVPLARKAGIPVLAIGDGGNEAGMGALGEELLKAVPGFAAALSVVAADVALPVDVSNWGGYGLAVLLSLRSGRRLGHLPGEEQAMLRALVAAGAVDGVTKRCELSVDGLPLLEHCRLVWRLENLRIRRGIEKELPEGSDLER
ncbi:DUF4392 domain-containing protein [Aminiphilus circumscriptus]|jgi:hypothetical protein|uniref:DUF4392 domain-containing protein n=1 Tax=Aminiphilus circumscriptus TaxID=290732 RepID=UPI0004B7770D|nr:DUF4392 domain-containing protein [Aminiphilus circumscriptus]